MAESAEDPIHEGVSWSAIGQFGSEGIRIVTGIALARLLSPTSFGLVGMVWVIASFAQVLLDFGFGAALVQRQDASRDDVSTVFWFNLAMGCALGSLLAACAPLIAGFFDQPALVGITMVLATNFPLLGFGMVPRTLLQKSLQFRQLAMVELVAATGSGAVALGLALQGGDTWALVAWLLVRSALTTAGTWWVGRWRPSWRFSLASLRRLGPFAASVVASEALGYAAQNADKLIVGRFLGAAALGLHEQATRLVLIPVAGISLMVARVLFPSLALIQQDPKRMGALFLQMCRLALFLAAPVMIGLASISRPFVEVVYGDAWEGLIPLLPIVCGLGIIGAITALTRSVFLSAGRADMHLAVMTARSVPVVGGSAAGVPWGLLGVAAGKVAGAAMGLLVTLWVMSRVIPISLAHHVRNLAPGLLAAGLMGLAVAALDQVLADLVPSAGALALEIAAGMLLYPLIAGLLRLEAWREARTLLTAFLRRRFP